MIVSKSSWHYRLYAWTKTFWSKFDDKSFNQLPDLCSYISTILLQAPLTGLIWLAAKLAVKFFHSIAVALRGLFRVMEWAFEGGGTMRELAATYVMLGIIGVVVGCLVRIPITGWSLATLTLVAERTLEILMFFSFIFLVVFLVTVVFPFLFRNARKATTTPFVQLATTWMRDKWNGTFCRVLTFVD